jgi:nitrogen-specific signal transduction histidine kinase
VDVPAVRGLIINARDVTEQRRLQEDLAQAQKLESIGQLAGGVAHDFNNLLVSILGNAEFLETALGPGHPSLPEVHDIRFAGQRARELTSQLLAVARRQIIAPRIVDLNDVVRDAEKLLRRVIGEDVAIEVRLAPGLWPTRADVGQLQQVLINLAVNARDAMPKGGRLTIETGNFEVPAARGSRPGALPDRQVLLRVSDTGEGMSEDVQRHVFEPFFTTKAPGKGTGLGLATVYGVVTQSGGQISFRSKAGAGTTFEILLPLAEGTVSPVPLEPARAPRRGTETILVVEDDAVAREVTVRALREAGYRVLVAVDARQAVTVFDDADGPVDLLLTDVVMPGGSGKEVAEVLRRVQPSLRVLYVSGYTQDAIVHQGILDSGVAFLPKPFTPSGLLAKIGEVFDGPATW